MPGTISRPSLVAQRYHFVTLACGVVIAFNVAVTPLGSVNGSILAEWPWDGNFTPMRNFSVDGSDAGAVKDILTSAGLWDASWQAYEVGDGGSYTSPIDNQTYTAQGAISRRFSDWVGTHSVKDDEQATDAQFGHGLLVPLVQGQLDLVTTGMVIPDPPAAPAPEFDPDQVGEIPNALELEEAQGQRLTAVAVGNRAVVGLTPIPA